MKQLTAIPSTHDRPRRLIRWLLSGLLGSCVFFAGYDFFYVGVWWSLLVIYLPCSAIFGLGLYAWRVLQIRSLLLFAWLMVLVDLALLGYGLWLCGQSGQQHWGLLTLSFLLPLSALIWQTFRAVKVLHAQATM